MKYIITRPHDGITLNADIHTEVLLDDKNLPMLFETPEAAKKYIEDLLGFPFEETDFSVEPKKYYGKHEFQNARAFIKDANVVSGYSDPCVSNTRYQNADGIWFEHWSKLEAPEDGYYLKFIEASL